ncbi:hypothetical protein AYL99_08466 [Fonsecaea erecta]|uniref:Uncharacterized protein n=1 Tax=Fonsecaea erecta TaxID=1367422 RepID=A0A178ZD92_9EURO|nr:hypothetical protein AYL99_08466 [Fonsecaea erecta]OAP57728.1 hypothetical protein AYL99_08466 [Fonsecaea erecta]
MSSSPPSPPPSPPSITAGRICLSLMALFTSTACYVADWNETHVKNPRWPPHARFHNGQTMSMGLCLGALTAYFAWRPVLAPAASSAPKKQQQQQQRGEIGAGQVADSKSNKSDSDSDSGAAGRDNERGIGEKESITIAAVLGSLYWVTGLSGILYPGTKWTDPEFGEGAPQAPIFVASAVLVWCGWWLEMRRLAKTKRA